MIKNWKLILCLLYLSAQVFLVISARFSSNRYFTWAPHDIQVEYYLTVHTKQTKLNKVQLNERYGLSNHGWIDLPPDHLIKHITEYERIHHNSKTDSVLIKYNVNGKNWVDWNWVNKNATDDD